MKNFAGDLPHNLISYNCIPPVFSKKAAHFRKLIYLFIYLFCNFPFFLIISLKKKLTYIANYNKLLTVQYLQ